MEALFAAERRLRECKAEEAELEKKLVVALESTDTVARHEATTIEAALAEARVAVADALTVVDYFQKKGEDLRTQTDLVRAVFHSRHDAELNGPVPFDEATWMSLTLHWSESNSRRHITGTLMTTLWVHFGVLEGPRADVERTMASITSDPRHADCSLLSLSKITEREHMFGLKLYVVADDLIATVLQRAQRDIIQASAYAPRPAVDVVVRGGDPEGIVPVHKPEVVAVAVVLDGECGTNYSAEDYVAAMRCVDASASEFGGTTVERFGETALLVFEMQHVTQAVSAAGCIVDKVANAVVSVNTGPATFVTAPHCWALGDGLEAAKRLVFLAERERRPLVLSRAVSDRCNKAIHRLAPFTIDAGEYATLQRLEDTRLGRNDATDDVQIASYTGMTAVVIPDDPVTRYRPMTNEERLDQHRSAAVVRGGITPAAIGEYFRQLDPGNCGWVGKDAVKKWLEPGSGAPFHVFLDHEWASLQKWLSKQNALGSSILNLAEFTQLCYRFASQ